MIDKREVALTVNGAPASEVSKYLDREEGIATRAGTLGAGALLQVLGLQGAVRASFGLHNTRQEVDLLVDTLERCVRSLPAG